MTQEDKELLLKDLSARLPYGVYVQQSSRYSKDNILAETWEKEPHDFKIIGIKKPNTLITDKVITTHTYAKGYTSTPVIICIEDGITHQVSLPYLRPMSSITDEEKRNLYSHYCKEFVDNISKELSWEIRSCIADSFGCDWLNAHHFDYRGLIEKGLAIEVPKGMYKTE